MEWNNMNTHLQEILLEGESVRWTGRPKAFELLGEDTKQEIVMTWGISVAVFILSLILLISACISGAMTFSKAMILFVIAMYLPVILSYRPFSDKKCLEQESFYAITNLRVIAIVKGEVKTIPLSKNVKVAVENQSQGLGNLSIGTAVGYSPKKGRMLAVVGKRNADDLNVTEGLLFYNVEHPEKLAAHFA